SLSLHALARSRICLQPASVDNPGGDGLKRHAPAHAFSTQHRKRCFLSDSMAAHQFESSAQQDTALLLAAFQLTKSVLGCAPARKVVRCNCQSAEHAGRTDRLREISRWPLCQHPFDT